MVELAGEVGGEAHGFRFIQLPFNLAMPEALTLINQEIDGEQITLLEAAQALGVTVVSSASIFQGRVAHGLPETVRAPLGSLASDAQTAIQFVRSTPGVTTALVGMSTAAHVEENLELTRCGACRQRTIHAVVFTVGQTFWSVARVRTDIQVCTYVCKRSHVRTTIQLVRGILATLRF